MHGQPATGELLARLNADGSLQADICVRWKSSRTVFRVRLIKKWQRDFAQSSSRVGLSMSAFRNRSYFRSCGAATPACRSSLFKSMNFTMSMYPLLARHMNFPSNWISSQGAQHRTSICSAICCDARLKIGAGTSIGSGVFSRQPFHERSHQSTSTFSIAG